MPELCHRCHGELPELAHGADPALFCAHCAAPQLRLAEHMRAGDSSLPAAAPPPLPGEAPGAHGLRGIDWQAALPVCAWVALVGAAFSVIGLRLRFVASLSPLWVLLSGGIVLAAYRRRRPHALASAKTGWRLGLVAGVLLVGAKGIALSATGVVERFALHGMAGYDAESARGAEMGEQWSRNMLGAGASADKAVMDRYRGFVASPEVRAGSLLVFAGFQALCIVLFAGLGGGASGAIEMRRRVVSGQ